MSRQPTPIVKTSSPAGTGPTGAHLEGQVGAQYLLCLLGAGVPRGLPAVTSITGVAFQRAGSGHPLDDIIVSGLVVSQPATLEIQVKRTLDFTAKNPVFADVVKRAVAASHKPEYRSHHYVLAAAIGRTSVKIERHVQWMLKWARDLQDPHTFFEHLRRPRFASPEEVRVVEAFRSQMAAAGAASDDAAVWDLLRHFLALPFDFEAPGSQAELLALERCVAALAEQESGRAGSDLWDALVQRSLSLDSAAGDETPESLRRYLAGRGYRLAGERRWRSARANLAEASRSALANIRTDVRALRLPRQHAIDAVHASLERGRYVEIRGAGGVGKSAVLATLAEQRQLESQLVVLAPARVPGGGWSALRAELGLDDATARAFLVDLAGDGGGMLLVDGIDRFDDPRERQTVVDLLQAAAAVPGFVVVATARDDFAADDAREWLPHGALDQLVEAPAVLLAELGDEEAQALASRDAALAALLADDHPARGLARNLYRLQRLAGKSQGAVLQPVSEAQMAWQWWDTGDSAEQSKRRQRHRLLRDLAKHLLMAAGPLMAPEQLDEAISQLERSGSLQVGRDNRLELKHDVLRDWAIGCLLIDEPQLLLQLPLARPAPGALVRGVEMAARLLAEREAAREKSPGGITWRQLLEHVSAGAHGSWRRAALLALPRSEKAEHVLTALQPLLAERDAGLLQELLNAVSGVDSQSGRTWPLAGIKLPEDVPGPLLHLPGGVSWARLIGWAVRYPHLVPDAAVPALMDLYDKWSLLLLTPAEIPKAALPHLPAMVEQLYGWLQRAEGPGRPEEYDREEEWFAATQLPSLALSGSDLRELKDLCRLRAAFAPRQARAYLQRVARRPRSQRNDFCRSLLDQSDGVATVVPKELADLFIDVLTQDLEGPSRFEGPFGIWDTTYYSPSPARRPFLDLLRASPADGLRLVRAVVAHVVARLAARIGGQQCAAARFTIRARGGTRAVTLPESYTWSRENRSAVLVSALMALEAWGHERIEAGEGVADVLLDVLGPDGSCAAFVAVAVDLVLSHLPDTLEDAAMLASSSWLLALDQSREDLEPMVLEQALMDVALGPTVTKLELPGYPTREELRGRSSRHRGLNGLIGWIGLRGPETMRTSVREALQCELAQLAHDPARLPVDPVLGADRPADPHAAATVALSQLDPSSPRDVTAEGEPSIANALAGSEEGPEERVDAANINAGRLLMSLYAAVQSPRVDAGLLETALAWLDQLLSVVGNADPADRDSDVRVWDRARTIIAMLVLRDGTAAQVHERREWAHHELAAAAARPVDSRLPVSLPDNDAAVAGMGWLASLRHDCTSQAECELLRLATRQDVALHRPLGLELALGRSVDARLGRSLVRLGLSSSIVELRDQAFGADEPEGDDSESGMSGAGALDRLAEAVEAERLWLAGAGTEPLWPEFPEPIFRMPARRRQRDRSERPHEGVSADAGAPAGPVHVVFHHAAVPWMRLAGQLLVPQEQVLARGLLDHFWHWTAQVNGLGVDGVDPEAAAAMPRIGWNAAYFELAARLEALDPAAGELHCLRRAAEFSETSFLEAAAAMLNVVDWQWLWDGLGNPVQLRRMREGVIERLMQTQRWRHLSSEIRDTADESLVTLVSALYFGKHQALGPSVVLIPGGKLDQVEEFLPLLADLAQHGARSPVVATAFVSLMEREPSLNYLPLLGRVHATWWTCNQDDRRFWGRFHLATRVCAWIVKAVDRGNVPVEQLRDEPWLVKTLDVLVGLGQPAAQDLARRVGQAS